MEKSFVQSSAMGGGGVGIFLQRPIALLLFALALALAVMLGPYLVKGARNLARS